MLVVCGGKQKQQSGRGRVLLLTFMLFTLVCAHLVLMLTLMCMLIVTFDPHVTLWTISPPRLSAEDKGKGTKGRQDLEMEITQAIKEGGEEAEIAYLVSLWSDQMDSDTVDNTRSQGNHGKTHH